MKLRIFLLLFLLSTTLYAQQVCTGTLGDPIADAGTTFGSGTASFGIAIPDKTTYRYVASNPEDGQYTIAKTTAGMNPGWHQNITNHTPNDPNGYMMVVNADYTQGIFFKSEVSDLCPNTTYEFASYIINILRNSGIKPNIRFTIENDGVPIGIGTETGDIPESSTPTWIKYGTTFTTPANLGVITLTMYNINPGGSGNDLAIDDITFRPCGPTLITALSNPNLAVGAIHANACEGDNITYTLEATPPIGYIKVAYQWQENKNGNWLDITGATDISYQIQFNSAIAGTYSYRLAVAEDINIGTLKCRVTSDPLMVQVNAKPIAKANNNGPYCEVGNIQLTASGGDSYQWTGPNNYSSNIQNPIIFNATTERSGDYTVTVFSNNCSNQAITTVQVLPFVVGSTNTSQINICENTSTTLTAYGGSIYSWFPTDGLSNPNDAVTIARPKETTTYTVKISNGACTDTKEVTVNVLKNAIAEAGSDKKIISGQSVNLKGKVFGDNVTYYWSPSDFLDNPNSLNPIATPTRDIMYTLNAISANCISSSDDVFIKVHPKIIIPSSFSPNGDGINDIWSIDAAYDFQNPHLKITNRYGALVYESKGKYKPWTGKLNGKDLPIGTYYYTIYFNDDFKTYSGWVFLIR